MDISKTAEPRSDQQNFDDYVAGPRTVTVSEVRVINGEQPVEVHLVEYPGRPYKPSKSMRRVLIKGWGNDSDNYVGKRLTLYGDPTVKYGGKEVGGIKIAAMSDIDAGFKLPLTETRGKKSLHQVARLDDAPTAKPSVSDRARQAVGAFAQHNVTQEDLEARIGKPLADWDEADMQQITAYWGEVTS